MTTVLAYTLERIMVQQAVIERDAGGTGTGPYGADQVPDWQPHLTVRCRHWWTRSSGVRSGQREYENPQGVVPVDQGGIMVPLGTDVTEDDRIVAILNRADTIVIGPMIEIQAVVVQDTHMELAIIRTALGG